jgi:hypothetical protein
MRRLILVCGAVSLLGGCASGPNRYQAAMAQIDSEAAGCPKAPMTANANCVISIERRVMGPLLGTNNDLLEVFTATRLSLAGKVDRHELRQEEAALQLAQAKSSLVSEFERRRTNQATVNALSAPQRLQTNCISTPGWVTCN